MKQRIIISGLGGQGALTLARILAEAAMSEGLEVLTSETHGMAQRGGTVISMVSVGAFRGPLIPAGHADTGFFLHGANLDVHRFLMRPGGMVFLNSSIPGDYHNIDAGAMAMKLEKPVIANLVLLGYAAGKGGLFCGDDVMEEVINKITPAPFLELNLKGFHAGIEAARKEI